MPTNNAKPQSIARDGGAPKVLLTQARRLRVHQTNKGAHVETIVSDGGTLTDPLAGILVPPQGGYLAKQCARRAHNDNCSLLDESMQDPPSAADLNRMEEGNVHENEIGAAQRALLTSRVAVFLEGDRSVESKRAREEATVDAMERGIRYIWNPRLPADLDASRIAEPDALVRVGKRRKGNGKWAYAPVDVNHHQSLEGKRAERAWPISELGAPWRETAVERVIGEGTVRLDDSMQLAHYHRALEPLGFAQTTPEVWGAVIGKERNLVWRDLTEELYRHADGDGENRKMSALDIYDQEFSHRLDVIRVAIAQGDDESLDPLALPEWKSECKSCPWQTVCFDDLSDADHVTLLPGVTPAKAVAHYQAGVVTRSQLARLDHRTALAVAAGVQNLEDLIDQAKTEPGDAPAQPLVANLRNHKTQTRALVEAGLETMADVASLDPRTAAYPAGHKDLPRAIDQARVFKAQKVHLKRGVAALEVPRAAIELHVDMENDPGGIIYLWGTYLVLNDPTLRIPGGTYRPFATFVADDHDGERDAFGALWAWMQCLKTLCDNTGLDFKAYCYTTAEDRCMRHLVNKHAGESGIPTSDELEAFLASDSWVDLHDIVSRQLLWPTEDLSLKTVAKWARFSWRDSEPGGDASVVWYRDAVRSEDETVRESAKQRLLEYNEDDVKATAHLMEWLSRLTAAKNQADRVPNVAALERRFRARRRARTA